MTPITVALTPEYDDIWQNCFNFGHEMMITPKFRRIFPTMEFQMSGLEQNKSYKLSMHFEHVDNLKYRFDNTTKGYTSSTSHEQKDPPKIVFHPRGSQTGLDWMSNSISFDIVRITCAKKLETESENYVHLLSGHCYQPVLTVYESDEPVHTSRIGKMVFLVTTTFHNEDIRAYKRSINKFSAKSEAEQKVGIVGRKRHSVPATLDSFVKKSRSQDDDGPSTSGAGTSGAGPSVAIPLNFGAVISSHLGLGASFNFGSHPVVLPMPSISPAEDPVGQKTSATPEKSKPIKSEVLSPSPATPTPKWPMCVRAAAPESVEPRSIKSEVDAPSATAPALPGSKNSLISPESIKAEVSDQQPYTPEVQIILGVAPDRSVRIWNEDIVPVTLDSLAKKARSQDDNEPPTSGAIPLKFAVAPSLHQSLGASFNSGCHPIALPMPPIFPALDFLVEQKTSATPEEPKSIKSEVSSSSPDLHPPIPGAQNSQQEAPRVPHWPAHPGKVMSRWERFTGDPIMPMMPMMQFGMMPYPVYANPMMLQAQPPVIPEPVEEENDEAEV